MPETKQYRPGILSGLSFRLLLLTVFFVMVAEFLIWTPSVSRFRKAYLEENVARAHLSMVAIEKMPDSPLDKKLEEALLYHTEAYAIVLNRPEKRLLMVTADMPPKVDLVIDKGQDPNSQGYSAFQETLLGDLLRERGVDRLYVAGLAAREDGDGDVGALHHALRDRGVDPAQPRRVAADAHHDLVDGLALGDRGDALGGEADLADGAEGHAGERQRLDGARHRGAAPLGAQLVARAAARELRHVAVEPGLDVEHQHLHGVHPVKRLEMLDGRERGARGIDGHEHFHCRTSFAFCGRRFCAQARPRTPPMTAT